MCCSQCCDSTEHNVAFKQDVVKQMTLRGNANLEQGFKLLRSGVTSVGALMQRDDAQNVQSGTWKESCRQLFKFWVDPSCFDRTRSKATQQ